MCQAHGRLGQNELSKLGTNGQAAKEIIKDVYGFLDGDICEIGLAGADDEEDFTVKLESLKIKWEKQAPGFHNWLI